MPSLYEIQHTILEQLKVGEFVKGMEDYYAEDVVNEEITGARIEGKAALLAHERKVLEGVAHFHGCTVHGFAAQDDGNGNGVTFAEYELKVDMKDGSTFNPKQTQVTQWSEGKATHVRFYYDPAKL